LQYALRRINNLLIRAKINKFKNKTERDKILKIGMIKKMSKKIDSSLRKELIKKYENDIIKLEKLINKDLSIWFV